MKDLNDHRLCLNQIYSKVHEIQHYQDADKPNLNSYLNKIKTAMLAYRDLISEITTKFILVVTAEESHHYEISILEELNLISLEADKLFGDLKELAILIKEEM